MPSNHDDSLSINRFKNVDPSSLSSSDHADYVLARLLAEIIKRLEASIQTERIFNRTKYDIMALVWDARDALYDDIKDDS